MRRMAPNKWCLVILPIAIILLVWLFGLSWFVVSNTPTNSPTSFPTFTPSPTSTSNAPTELPTNTPTQTPAPTVRTGSPTSGSLKPTAVPTSASLAPTGVPTTTSFAPTGEPTAGSLAPTGSPTTVTPAPTVTIVPTRTPTAAPTASLNVSNCVCPPGTEPIYNTFPHPLHTNESYVQLNFLNDRGVDFNGNNLTVWVTVVITADARMATEDPRFMDAYQYVYLDAYPLARGQSLFFTIPYNTTGAGRMSGGRIHIYYRDPALHDTVRQLRYGGHYPTQESQITPITNDQGKPIGISQSFQGLLEFSIDVVSGTNPLTSAFLGYDYSAVDGFALPMYMYGGNDPLLQPTLENNISCKKAYVACQTPQAIQEGCPTQIEQNTTSGSTCLSSFIYCARDPTIPGLVVNLTNWNLYCHRFDTLAAQFNITEAKLAFYRACITQVPKAPGCPAADLNFLTPTAVIYGCIGQFLLENHCREADGSNVTGSTLSTDQCTALNRGVCFNPNNQSIPLNGLSCSLFNCTATGPKCFVPCFDYQVCYGFHCADYDNFEEFDAQCDGAICLTGRNTTNCIDNRAIPAAQSVDPGCNGTTLNPYTYPNPKNEYSAWVRSKGTFLYGFSLDERGPGGAFQACRFSTQLDVVIYPACNGTSVP